MKITEEDSREIKNFIKQHSECDIESISKNVELLANHPNPLPDLISNFRRDADIDNAMQFLIKDTDFQEYIECVWWDLLTKLETAKYAIDTFKSMHSYNEVA